MRLFITLLALLYCVAGYSQTSITGKWKPIYFSLDTMFRGDIKADTFHVNPALKEQFKDDEDPAASEKLVRYMMEIMFEKTKALQEEYLEDGKYIETNTQSGRSKMGSYTYDAKEGKLERSFGQSPEKQKFTVTWKDGHLILTGELRNSNDKKGKLEIVYEKI